MPFEPSAFSDGPAPRDLRAASCEPPPPPPLHSPARLPRPTHFVPHIEHALLSTRQGTSSLSDFNKLLTRCAWAGTAAFASAGYGSDWGPGSCPPPPSPRSPDSSGVGGIAGAAAAGTVALLLLIAGGAALFQRRKRRAARRAAAGGHAADVGPSLNNGVELGVIATSGGHDGLPIAIGRPIAAADPWADRPPPYT